MEALAEREHRHGHGEHTNAAEPESQSRCDRDEQPRGRPDDADQREEGHRVVPSSKPSDRQLQQDDDERVDEEEPADPGLRDAGLVLRERRQDLELRDAGPDVERVHDHQRHEDPVPEDVPVGARALAPSHSAARGLVHERGQHGGVGDERKRVEQEEDAKALGGDWIAARDAAEADAEVHHDPLHRERWPIAARAV